MHAYDKRWLQSYHISVCVLSQHLYFSPYMSLLLMCLDVLRFDRGCFICIWHINASRVDPVTGGLKLTT